MHAHTHTHAHTHMRELIIETRGMLHTHNDEENIHVEYTTHDQQQELVKKKKKKQEKKKKKKRFDVGYVIKKISEMKK